MVTSRILTALILIALVTAIIGAIVDPAFAQRVPNPPGGTVRGAPGPLAGAGLMTIGIGAAAYWLYRLFRKKS